MRLSTTCKWGDFPNFPPDAGFAVVDLDPPSGGSMPGYFAGRKAAGFIDPIQPRRIVPSDSATTGDAVAIVSLDLVALGRDECEMIRKAVAVGGKIRPERVWFYATHTHTGPMVPRFFAPTSVPFFPVSIPAESIPSFSRGSSIARRNALQQPRRKP